MGYYIADELGNIIVTNLSESQAIHILEYQKKYIKIEKTKK